MGVIRIAPEPPVSQRACASCGGTMSRLHGYVFEDEFTHGLYFVDWCEGRHETKLAVLTLGLGAFGEGSDGHDRLAFCLEWRAQGWRLAERPLLDQPELLGRFLPGERVLEIHDVEHLWHVVDRIVLDDDRLVRLREWLELP